MKKDTHSKDYRLVVFEDSSCNYSFLTRSTVKTDKTVKWEDGNEYPLFKLDISDKSHPYYTGQRTLVILLEELKNSTANTIKKILKDSFFNNLFN
ncbi:MAG: hypothetical protein CM15mP23_22990 [Cryomorphaceae bacterium]|nr:MAG: hypothetical protein CM15mP23_22990 [Cryomorphaceae bacterium]